MPSALTMPLRVTLVLPIFALLFLRFHPTAALVVNLYNDSACSSVTFLSAYSHAWATVGPWGSFRSLNCSVNVSDVVATTQTFDSLQYACFADNNNNTQAQLNIYNVSVDPLCDELPDVIISFNPAPAGQCTTASVIDNTYNPPQSLRVWATINCSASSPVNVSSSSSPARNGGVPSAVSSALAITLPLVAFAAM